jgi:hypothetical protein
MSTNDEADAGILCMEMCRPQGRVQPEPGRPMCGYWVRRDWRAGALIRLEPRSALPGEQSAVYRTTGSFWEHGNLDRGAELAKLGKPPRAPCGLPTSRSGSREGSRGHPAELLPPTRIGCGCWHSSIYKNIGENE